MQFIFILTQIIILSSCTLNGINFNKFFLFTPNVNLQQEQKNSNFNIKNISIETKLFEDIDEAKNINVVISYPEVHGLIDEEFQTKINDLFKEMAFFNYIPDVKDIPEITGFHLSERYEYFITHQNILSIQFYTNYDYSTATHPWQDMTGYNINLETGDILKLSDVIDTGIEFHNLFKRGVFTCDRISHEDISEWGYYDKWLKYLHDDNIYSFYLTEDSFNLIVGVSHVEGDYWVFSAEYQNIKNILKI